MDPKQKETLKKMKTETLVRSFGIEQRNINEEARTLEVAFSSETPVARWFGDEILDHQKSSVRLDRLKDGGPLLVDHNARDHVGTIEEVRLDSDKVGRALVRFGKSARAEEIFQDVLDGIRKKISITYRIYKAVVEDRNEDGEPTGYRAMDWEPFEVSFVSMAADNTVGVGRSESQDITEFPIDLAADDKPAALKREVKKMDSVDNNNTHTQADIDAARQAANAENAKRTKEVLDAGDEYAKFGGKDIARDILSGGGDLEAFNLRMLKEMGKADATRADPPELGLNDNEVKQFSLVRALRALANPTDSRAQKDAAFEFEVSSAASEKMKKESRGILLPIDILRSPVNQGMDKRDLVVGTPTAGGHTVATNLLSGSFIDMLRNRSVMMQLATVLTDLNGNLAIPRQTGGATAYWVGEGSAPSESQQAFDQVTLSPNTLAAYTEFSRKLMLQSSMDVEGFVRMDLMKVLALEIDRVAINGSGIGAEPLGILGLTGIGDVAGGTNGAAPTWNHIVDLESAVAIDNADVGSLAYIVNAVTRGKLKKTFVDAGSGERVWDGRSPGSPLNGYNALVTNQVPSNLDKGSASGICSAILFGNIADLIIGLWGGLDVQVNPYSLDTTGSVRVTAFQDADVAARHGQSFAAMQDALSN